MNPIATLFEDGGSTSRYIVRLLQVGAINLFPFGTLGFKTRRRYYHPQALKGLTYHCVKILAQARSEAAVLCYTSRRPVWPGRASTGLQELRDQTTIELLIYRSWERGLNAEEVRTVLSYYDSPMGQHQLGNFKEYAKVKLDLEDDAHVNVPELVL